MKTNLICSIFFICFAFLQAQDETVQLDFVGAEPVWQHVISDTTFEEISGQSFWTKHSSLSLNIIERKLDDLYILASSKTPRQFSDFYGFVLDKIDIHSGEVLWKHHNTQYNGGNQDFYNRIHFTSEGNLDLIGVEPYQMDGEGGNWSLGAYHSQSIRKVISHQEGEMLESIQDQEKINEIKVPSLYFHQFSLFPDSLYLTATMVGEDSGPPGAPDYNYGVSYQLRNKDLAVIDTIRLLFDFEDLGPFSIDQGPFLNRLNDETLVSLAFRDRYDSWDNMGQQLMWTDLSDPYDLKTKRIIDLKDFVPNSKESFLLLSFTCLNNTIFLSHRYPNFDIQENVAYILWLSAQGEVKTFIEAPYHEDHLYQYSDIFYASEDYAYLFAFPSHTGRMGYDIIKIEDGVDTLDYISSISVANEGVEFSIAAHSVYDDGNVVFGGLVKQSGQASKTSDQLFCFRAEDLGMELNPVSSVEFQKSPELKTYPNPFSNKITLDCPDCGYEGSIKILNSLGQEVMNKRWIGRGTVLDLNQLADGMYIAQIINAEQRIMASQMIIKTH